MENVKVLSKEIVNELMEDGNTSPQTMYELSIPVTDLTVGNRIRFSFTASRLLTPPTCIDASEAIDGLQKICDFTCPLGQYSEAEYNGGIDPGGPVIRLLETGTSVNNFTGYGAIYIPDQGGIALARWNNQSLRDLPVIGSSGAILAAVPYGLVTGDILKIKASETTLYTYEVYVNDVLIISYSDNPGLDVTNPCYGLLDITRVTRDITVFYPGEEAPPEEDGFG